MADNYDVKIKTWGKAFETIESDCPERAVSTLVASIAKRIGEHPTMTAKRLDKEAEVKQGKGSLMKVNIVEAVQSFHGEPPAFVPASELPDEPEPQKDEVDQSMEEGLMEYLEGNGL